jgi:hypothetical protein
MAPTTDRKTPVTNDPFNESDRVNMATFFEHVLAGHKAGTIQPEAAVGALVSTMTALGAGDLDLARAWFEEGRKHASRGTVPHR